MSDPAKIRREAGRWHLLLALDHARPLGAYDSLLLATLRDEYPDATANELRRKLEYLEGRELVEIKRCPDGRWLSKLTRHGIDVVEYTVDCDPGIARPAKYWNG